MTVLVGIKCKEGIVIGSDSSVTFGTLGGRTIEQSARKIEIIEGVIIVAGTGQVGLSQRFSHVISAGYKGKKFTGKVGVEIGKEMAKLAIQDFHETASTRGVFGALVAFPTKHELHLCEFAIDDFQPELKTDQIWYASMGSGQIIADPFLGLMRKVFWKDGMPSLQDGVFATAWTIQHTIDVNAGGVNGPMHLAILEKDKTGTAQARLLTEEEVGQHLENVSGGEKYLHSYRDVLQGTNINEVPDVPKPKQATPCN